LFNIIQFQGVERGHDKATTKILTFNQGFKLFLKE